MQKTILRDVEHLHGTGMLTKAAKEISHCTYALEVSRKFLVVESLDGVCEYPYLLTAVGTFTARSHRIARGDILTLHLDDGRQIYILIDSIDPGSRVYHVVATGMPR